MKTIKGSFSGNDNYGVMEWACPETGKLMSMDGQFAFDEDGYWHDVLSEDDEYLYTVVSYVPRNEREFMIADRSGRGAVVVVKMDKVMADYANTLDEDDEPVTATIISMEMGDKWRDDDNNLTITRIK